MKKQTNKLVLNKRTITNLEHDEMKKRLGGRASDWGVATCYYCTYTCHGKSCNRKCTF